MIGAHRLKHMAQTGAAAVLQVTGQHGAAGDEDGGHVDPRGGHEQTGHVLVAVGDHDQTVELMGDGHTFGGVGDEVTGDQRVFHADVPHGDAVTDGDGGEHDGGAASHADASLDRFCDLVQIHVAGDDLVVGADDTDQRPVGLFLGKAQRSEQTAVGGAIHPLGDVSRFQCHMGSS